MSVSISREKTVFYEALDVADPAQRREFLDQACASDAELRVAVEELLAVHADSEQFFDDCASSVMALPADEIESAAALTAELCGSAFEEKPGTFIGRYKLLQKIGEGGGGLVYLAEQEQPVRRRVALKVIKLGMDTKNVIARFEAERQALAMMDHPNIARVLDAGATDTGRPYFVMELVNGVKITEYCDQNRLGLEQRLELFIQVCHAIQHAHQKGIIHRDIKPSNVLVTMLDGVPVPKVIDFGIAKATNDLLTDKTLLFTAYAQLIGTPAYMSPEQMELGGLDLDTRSDIYSLGVLLYELLTGRTPFDSRELLKSGVEAMRRTLREREPSCPSAKLRALDGEELTKTARQRHIELPKLLSQLRGDLDWIVMKALEKDRNRRYQTAIGLGVDVQHYLNHEPVVARPPSNWYRLQKLVRRNRVIFLAGSAVVAALLIGTVTSTWLFIQERDARAKETKLRQESEQHVQVALLVLQREFLEADKLLLHNIALEKPSIEAAAELRALGDWHAVNGRWRQAVERFALATRVDQLDDPEVFAEDQVKLGAALVESGDLRGYEQFRQTAIARFTAASYPAAAGRVAVHFYSDLVARFTASSYPMADWTIKVALLLPADQRMLGSLRPQGELVKNSFQPEGVPTNQAQEARRAETMALLEYRRGNYATAAGWCQRCLANPVYHPPTTAGARLIWAMSCWHLDDKWQALVQWSFGQELVAAKFDQGLDRGDALEGFWFDWVIARLLMRECDQQFAEADRSFVPTSMSQPGTNDLAMTRILGEWHALHQDWRGAEEHFRTLLKMNRFDWWGNVTLDYLDYGVTSVELGDTMDYERSREQVIERFKGTDNKIIAQRVLNTSLILPANSNLMAALEPMAELAANPSPNSDGNALYGNAYPAWCSMSVALFEYRRGQYAKAAEWSGRCLADPNCLPLPGTTARIILAMSLQQLGKHETARSVLGLAQTSIQNGFKTNFNQYNWRDWVFARILLREALQLPGGSLKTNPE